MAHPRQRYRPKRQARPVRVYTAADRAADEALRSPEALMARIREHYLDQCAPALHAYLSAPAYGLLHADAHSSVHPDLVGPVVKSRDEAVALLDQARATRPDVECVIVAGVTPRRREWLAQCGVEIADTDLMAPGTRIFIDRDGRTPKALLRAHRRDGAPLETPLPTPPVGVL